VDEQVVIDTTGPNALVTGRKPGDLADFCRQAIDALSG
jgi:deglycase